VDATYVQGRGLHDQSVAFVSRICSSEKTKFFIHRYYHYLPMEDGSALFVSCRMDEIERNIFPDLQFFIFFDLNSNFLIRENVVDG
jgi:hypothetical protein